MHSLYKTKAYIYTNTLSKVSVSRGTAPLVVPSTFWKPKLANAITVIKPAKSISFDYYELPSLQALCKLFQFQSCFQSSNVFACGDFWD